MIASFSVTPSWCLLLGFDRPEVRFRAPLLSTSAGVGHAEDEGSLPLVARADFCRREQSDLTRETKSAQVSVNALGAAAGKHPFDVLDEDEPRSGLDDDASRRGPEIARVGSLKPLSSKAVRLARDAANEAVHASTPASAIEGSGIAPQRRWSHEPRFHC